MPFTRGNSATCRQTGLIPSVRHRGMYVSPRGHHTGCYPRLASASASCPSCNSMAQERDCSTRANVLGGTWVAASGSRHMTALLLMEACGLRTGTYHGMPIPVLNQTEGGMGRTD